jgi:hypothetical protein
VIDLSNFFENLNEFLVRNVNAKISAKQKDSLQNIHEYGIFRANLEENLVLDVDFRPWIERLNLTAPTQSDYEMVVNLSDDDLMRDVVVLNHALSRYIDSFSETSRTCQTLHSFYKLLKLEVMRRPTLKFFPSGDGFSEYLEKRVERIAENSELIDARRCGNICIFCQSKNVKSYSSTEWKCKDCKRRFRKH